MKVIDAAALAELSAQAAERPRLRLNLNLHAGPEDSIQRMVIAFEPGTYVRPHRHPAQFETFVLLRGRCSLLRFAEDGRVEERVELAEDGVRLVEIPAGTWHSLISRASGTQVVEVKPGPYRPTGEEDFAAWAPAEGSDRAAVCRMWMEAGVPGEIFPP